MSRKGGWGGGRESLEGGGEPDLLPMMPRHPSFSCRGASPAPLPP
jgi:hypothetical protein